MVDDAAVRVRSARSRTRVDAFVVDATSARRTIGCRHALGPAAGRNANHAGHARALGHSVDYCAPGVVAARVRRARAGRKRGQNALDGQRRPDGRRNDLTILAAVRIAGVAGRTVAERNAVGYRTNGQTAKARARINAATVDARLRRRALAVGDAFRPAARQFRAGVAREANADGRAARRQLTLTVGHLARIRIARLDH